MKYMLMLIRSDEEWEALGDAERDYEAIGRWWARHAQTGHVVSGHELQPARTATTVEWRGGRPVVVDGPYLEAKETIEVDDLDISCRRPWRRATPRRPRGRRPDILRCVSA